METLKQFSEKERDYHAYQARQNHLREQSKKAGRSLSPSPGNRP